MTAAQKDKFRELFSELSYFELRSIKLLLAEAFNKLKYKENVLERETDLDAISNLPD